MAQSYRRWDPHINREETALGGVYVSSVTASASPTVVFTGLSTYDVYTIVLSDVASANDAVNLLLRVSTDNGSSYVSSANYGWTGFSSDSAAATAAAGSGGATSMQLMASMGNADASEAGSGVVQLVHRGSGSSVSRFLFDFSYRGSVPTYFRSVGSGSYNVGAAVNALQFFMSAGNIARGTFRLYGLKES